MQMLKIIKCSDGMRWYASKVGELVPYLGDSMGAYKSREDAGYINFVHYEDAEVMPELTQLEQLQKAVVDTKAADAVAEATWDAAYAAAKAAEAVAEATYAVAEAAADAAYAAADAAYDAAYAAKDAAYAGADAWLELKEYLKEQVE